MIAATPQAAELMCRGAAALAAATAAGIRVDTVYLDSAISDVRGQIKAIDAELRETEEFKHMSKQYGAKVNIGSRDQIGYVLFDVLGHKPLAYTGGREGGDGLKKGRPQVDEAALRAVGTPFCTKLLQREKLSKLEGTYLSGFRRETVDGYLHANFTLHNVVTYRGAGNDPNFQNIPIRNKEMAKWIRRAFIPRPGHVILEIDLKQNEVRVSCCYSGDERLIYDTLEGDMHRDMAAECFLLPQNDVPKPVRNLAKGGFVFAEFYGSYYVDVARSLWDDAAKLKLNDGATLVHDHLAANGIRERGACETGKRQDPKPGSFEAHIKQVETRFWGERFHVHDAWRKQWWQDYLTNGYFQMLTGFVVTYGKAGLLRRNEAINSPVQGSAFHCLLWGLIRLGDWLRKNKMKSVIVAQIHDSIIIDAHKDEWQAVAAKARELLVDSIRQYWPWLIVPLDTELEMAETNWFEKKEVKL